MIVAGYTLGPHVLIGGVLLLVALVVTGAASWRGRSGELSANAAWLAIFGALLVIFPSVWLP